MKKQTMEATLRSRDISGIRKKQHVNNLTILLRPRDLKKGFDFQFLSYYPCLESLEIVMERRHGDETRHSSSLNDLIGIESCTHLKSLSIRGVPFESLHGIEYCSKLEHLFFASTVIISLSIMIGLEYLETIHFYDSEFLPEFTDSSMLSDLKSLKEVQIIQCTGIRDLELIRGLHLKKLICNDSGLESIKGVNFDEMKHLDLGCNLIKRVTRIRRAKKLIRIRLCQNRIISLDPIKHLMKSKCHLGLCSYQNPYPELVDSCDFECKMKFFY